VTLSDADKDCTVDPVFYIAAVRCRDLEQTELASRAFLEIHRIHLAFHDWFSFMFS